MRAMLKSFATASMLVFAAAPALAQADDAKTLDRRLKAIETDVRALKRQVLPSGTQRLIEPEVDTSRADPAAPPPEKPASASVVADLSTRMGAAEAGQRRLTAQIEELTERVRRLETEQGKLRGDLEARLAKLEAAAAPAPAAAAPTPEAVAPPVAPATTPPPKPAAQPADAATRPATAAAKPAEDAPAKPAVASAKTADEAYKLAYAPVEAKDWPRAETELKAFIARYPKHRLASFARYWLGRTYYAENRYEDSARTHTANYDADPKGERAQESLYWVGQSLVQLKRPEAACQVYDLARKVYDTELKPELKPQFAAARARAGCPA
jgi:TolA-binding protein